MLEIIKAGGWLMWPIVACSIVSLAIITERFWALRTSRILPRQLVSQVWNLHKKNQLDSVHVRQMKMSSPLGAVLAAGLANHRHGREVMKESLEEAGRQVVHHLERYLTTLGTIAAISPYLGLLGSVLGMIDVFSTFSASGGVSNPTRLAGGISQILIATAAGLTVAIPSLMFYRYFQGRVNELALRMEAEALKLVEIMQGEREE